MPQEIDFASKILDPEAQKRKQTEIDFFEKLEAKREETFARGVGQAELGDEQLRLSTRLSIAQADTHEEKVATFLRAFPEGELVQGPVHSPLLFRTDQSKAFSRVDPQEFEFGADVAEFLIRDAGAITGEIAATVGTRGQNLLPILARLMFGAAVGELTQEQIETVRGLQREGLAEQGVRIGVQSVTALGGGLIASPFVGALNVARGGGALRIPPESQVALKEAEKIGLKPGLTPAQVSDNPIVILLERQAAATVPAFRRYYSRQQAFLRGEAKEAVNRGDLILLRDRVLQADKQAREGILRQARDPSVSAREGGEALQAGVQRYREISGAQVDEFYFIARQIEEPRFELKPALTLARDIIEGKFGQVDPAVRQQAIELFKLVPRAPSPSARKILLDLIDDPATDEPLRQAIKASLEPASRKLPSGDVLSVTDQIRNIRTKLGDIGAPPPGQRAVQTSKQATSIREALSDVLDTPLNVSDTFRTAWKTANDFAKQRIENLERLAVVSVAKSEAPEQLARTLAKPFSVSPLKTLRSIVPVEKFSKFQQSFKAQLLDNADDLTKTLDNFDKETLDILLSPAEQQMFRRMGRSIDELNILKAGAVGQRQTANRGFIRELFSGNVTGATRALRTLVARGGGKESPIGKSVRAAIMDEAIEKMFRIQGSGALAGIRTLDQRGVERVVEELINSGQASLLKRADIAFLRSMRKLAPRLAKTGDAGTAIQAAEVAAGVPRGELSAYLTILKHSTVARIYLSKGGRRFLLGSGRKQTPGVPLRTATAMAAQLSHDLQQEQDLRELLNNGT